MGIWKNNPSIDTENKALDKKREAIQQEIEALRNKVQILSDTKPSSTKAVSLDTEEIRPLEGHHPFHPRKKDPSPSLRSHQNRDRNLFFILMGVFIFLVFFIIRYLKH